MQTHCKEKFYIVSFVPEDLKALLQYLVSRLKESEKLKNRKVYFNIDVVGERCSVILGQLLIELN